MNERLRQPLQGKDLLNVDTRLIYGKNELQPGEGV